MLWFLGFIALFTIGGVAGLMLGVPPADFQLHNSLFLVAHFHSNVIGGVLFGIFCGINYWFPKFAGFKLNERIGRSAFWCWIVGFCLSFIPMYILGIMGATRRLDHYEAATGWQPFYILMLIGGLVICTGVALQLAQILASIIDRKRLADHTGDPWDGRSLEWATASPPAPYNFTVIPTVTSRDAFLDLKRQNLPKTYEDIHIPKNTASGIYISLFAFLAGFGFVWEIVWLWVVSLVAIIICIIIRTFDDHTEYTLTAAQVKQMEADRAERTRKAQAAAPAVDPDAEEMGIWDLVKVVVLWALNVIRTRGWRRW
jgi:cytochrome o ubiquinol oxidase subunit 1